MKLVCEEGRFLIADDIEGTLKAVRTASGKHHGSKSSSTSSAKAAMAGNFPPAPAQAPRRVSLPAQQAVGEALRGANDDNEERTTTTRSEATS